MTDDRVPEIEVTGVESVRLEDGGAVAVITFATVAGGLQVVRMPREEADQLLAQLKSGCLPNEAVPAPLADLIHGLTEIQKKDKTTH